MNLPLKLTDWFPGSIKPERPGIYQQMCGLGKQVGYQRWDGNYWYIWECTPEDAQHASMRSREQHDPWRGLAYDPVALPNNLMPNTRETD